MFPFQPTISSPVDATSAFCDHITVVTAGTPVTGPSVFNPGGFYIKGLLTNTKPVYYFGAAQTKTANGFPLDIGEVMFIPVQSLSLVKFDSDVNGEGLAWTKA